MTFDRHALGFGFSARAIYASDPWATRGRLYPETGSPTRSDFQRDRDRIVHTTAFRRLKHKTQVFIAHEGDHYRTRLTHTIEVAQIARALARALKLDEDLAEGVALVHDFGHTPFGHTGEDALHELLKPYGGFDHNAQSLRIVTKLERRYAEFDGLNLTWESLEGLVKHNGPLLSLLYFFVLEVTDPALQGITKGQYAGHTNKLSTTRRQLKRMLRGRKLNLVFHDCTHCDWSVRRKQAQANPSKD